MTAAIGFLAASVESADWSDEAWDSGRNPELCLYRDRTTAILRKFFRLSVEMGRLPSILGQEFFRTHVTSYGISSFEDTVIFVHDVERCLGKLDKLAQQLIARVILQGFSYEEAAVLLGCCRKTVHRRLPDALDQLSEIFLAVGLVKPMMVPAAAVEEACQEREDDETLVIM
jgi:DNA-directed RNA polymerase specialized sigma24 family protein